MAADSILKVRKKVRKLDDAMRLAILDDLDLTERRLQSKLNESHQEVERAQARARRHGPEVRISLNKGKGWARLKKLNHVSSGVEDYDIGHFII